jgi:hypothetical protein
VRDHYFIWMLNSLISASIDALTKIYHILWNNLDMVHMKLSLKHGLITFSEISHTLRIMLRNILSKKTYCFKENLFHSGSDTHQEKRSIIYTTSAT